MTVEFSNVGFEIGRSGRRGKSDGGSIEAPQFSLLLPEDYTEGIPLASSTLLQSLPMDPT